MTDGWGGAGTYQAVTGSREHGVAADPQTSYDSHVFSKSWGDPAGLPLSGPYPEESGGPYGMARQAAGKLKDLLTGSEEGTSRG